MDRQARTSNDFPAGKGGTPASGARRRSGFTLLAIFLITLAPILAAVIVYFNPQWWPQDASNYGTLVHPQRDIPAPGQLPLAMLDGQPFDLRTLKGKWLLVAADGGACPDACARKLFIIRNTHASQGKNVERLARVWFITDDAPVPQKVLDAYQGTIMVRARPDQLAPFLLGPDAAGLDAAAAGAALDSPMWIVDPLGHLMMQYPANADPIKVRDDVRKLISNSRIG
jgi:hypothetical protein